MKIVIEREVFTEPEELLVWWVQLRVFLFIQAGTLTTNCHIDCDTMVGQLYEK